MKGYMGTTIFPFIFYSKKTLNKLSEKQKAIFWNHEKHIHGAQQKELWLIGFYVLYFYYYFKNRKAGMSKSEAYHNNPFEMEAHDHESNLNYKNIRKKNAWKLYR
jgi:hypothetical protein